MVENVIRDLAEENTLACSALFRIADIRYSDTVPTLAVSLSSRPTLLINRSFLEQYLQCEDDLKAALVHEFLHVLLRHTEKYSTNTPLLNIALDAIINSTIHRLFGPRYSNLFVRLYKDHGIEKLLRPAEPKQRPTAGDLWENLRERIYKGEFAADDLHELILFLRKKQQVREGLLFTGNHGDLQETISAENEQLLGDLIRRADGKGIWKNQVIHGTAKELNADESDRSSHMAWRHGTHRLLNQCLIPDPRETQARESRVILPMISSGDRRAFATLRMSPFIPFSSMLLTSRGAAEKVNIYLDVSGSMANELKEITSLLMHFRDRIRMPLWAFSNEVEKARFRNGRLTTKTTTGTSIRCVFDHIRARGFKRNLIITDGYTEAISIDMLEGIDRSGLRVLVSADGSAVRFAEWGIPYHLLQPIKP